MRKLDIVNSARSWVGTPYHHQGRKKHVGADCIGILVGAIKDLNLMSGRTDHKGRSIPLASFDDTQYSWNPNGKKLQSIIATHFKEIPVESIEPGDIVLMRWEKEPQHVAYVSNYGEGLGLIHSYRGSGKCVEHILDDRWKKHIVKAYEVVSNG